LLTPRGHAAVAQAKQLTLGRPPVAGLPPREGAAITVASGQSSLESFRVGIRVASALAIIGGLIGAAGIRNPKPSPCRRVLRRAARRRPLDAARVHACNQPDLRAAASAT
jgi:hypothetical protein